MTPVYFVLYHDMLAMSLSLPIEMLQAANDLYKARNKKDGIHIALVSDQSRAIKTKSGIEITPEFTLHQLNSNQQKSGNDESPVIFLPALWRSPQHSLQKHQDIIDWLDLQIEQGATVCAAGTGACYLAETGRLNGKPATTHWYYFDHFQKKYPAIQLKRQHLITQAGKLYCAGSVNALADLTIHVIGQLFDRSISAHVERHFSQEARQSFENISFLDDKPSRHQDEDVIQIQLWLNQNFNKSFSLSEIAQKFGMSTRNFNRRFKAATGKTPLRYLQELRISSARDLLKNSNLSIAETAERVGYQDVAHFSELYKEITHATPSHYRKTVRGKLFSL